MAQRVVFHIGLMKSGTTFIQGRLNANRARLADQGILFPGPTWARHVRAVSDLMQAKNRKPGSWASLTEEINDHPGTAIVSMEYLAPMGGPRIAALRRSFPETEIRVAVTVRDLGRSVPARGRGAVGDCSCDREPEQRKHKCGCEQNDLPFHSPLSLRRG